MTTKVKWLEVKKDKRRNDIIREFNTHPEIEKLSTVAKDILINREVTTVEEVLEILDDDIMNQHNPLELKDMDKMVSLLKQYVQESKHIVIYGDYDSDGACATAIAVLCLRELGVQVDYFINNRFVHGYGMTPKGVQDLIKRYPTTDVILTVDNGIVAFEGIEAAVRAGIDVLITDHHEPLPDGTLPNALAVVNPKRLDDTYPFSEICGATVIYKVMLSLYMELGEPLDYVYSMIDIVGMATVGDVMPLRDENRLFVKEAIKQINRNPRYAFKALKRKLDEARLMKVPLVSNLCL